MKQKRVIFIDTANRTVSETTVATLDDMQKLVGGLIERATVLENGDELYVNEEGFFDSNPQLFFIDGAHQWFAGNAYIIGSVTDSGNNRPAKSTIGEIVKKVNFGGRI